MHAPRIVIIAGDLVEQQVDAIVNAANNELMLGGGVAGAIRRRGGPAIQRECDVHGPVEVGEAASMQLGGRTTNESLRSSMDHAFRLAREHAVRTIAVPAVGTGIAGFPMDECARIMRECVDRALSDGWQPDEVRFVMFDERALRVFEESF